MTTTAAVTRHPLSMPNLLLRLEGLVLLVAAIALYAHIGGGWLLFIALLLAPDLSALGYFAGQRVGSVCYNIAHTIALPIALGLASLFLGWQLGIALCLIWLAHIGMDRAVGYGFKYVTSFKDTHMQRV